MHNNGPCNVVSEPAVLRVAHHRDQPNRVETRENIKAAHQITANALDRGHGPSGLMNYPNPGDPLTWRSTLPENLKKGEVAPVHAERDEDQHNRGHGLREEFVNSSK